MQEGQNGRQQVVDRIKQATSILVAVGQNPSVDALSAALGLSLMLNKMNKHTTAVFSGQIPPAMQFLEPTKLFENNVDALRDFIISLDKEKADRLRYKVEDDVVRIFITPYKTSISEKDLQFSQGDFNVDLVIALGVEKRDDLDKAIVAHGRILHDATVATINADTQHSSVGSIDWNDGQASCLCEMLVGMSEAFQQPGLLDAQISNALLTGIVAATERFSNGKTNPRVMTMAAQLMAAGANQQLIATNLTKAHEIPEITQPPVAKQQPAAVPQPMEQTPQKKNDGELDIAHEKPKEQMQPVAPVVQTTQTVPTPAPAPQSTQAAEDELAAALPSSAAAANALNELKSQLEAATPAVPEVGKAKESNEEAQAPGTASVNMPAEEPKNDEEYISSHSSWRGKRLEPPTLGGTLNATAEEALEDKNRADEEDRNQMLLTHPDDNSVSDEKSKKSRRDRRKDKNTEREQSKDQLQAAQAPTPVAPPIEPPQSAPTQPVEPETVAQQPSAPESASGNNAITPTPTPALNPTPEMPVEPTMPDLPPLPPMPSEPTPQPAPIITAPAPQAVEQKLPEASQPIADLDSARQAVNEALAAVPIEPEPTPIPAAPQISVPEQNSAVAPELMPVQKPAQSIEMPVEPTMPDLPPLPPMPPMPPMPQGGEAPLPPAPDLPGLNEPLPPIATAPAQAPEQAPPANISPSDPGQFKIPGA